MTETANTCNFHGQSLARCFTSVILAGMILLMPLAAFAHTQRIELEEGKTCYMSDEYAVLVAERPDAGDNMFVSLRGEGRDLESDCAFSPGNVDFAIAKRYFYFLGFERHYLLYTSFTGPGPVPLWVHDLKKRRMVFDTTYHDSYPLNINGLEVTFWENLGENPADAECPEAEKWTSGGLGTGYEEQVVLNLSTLKVERSGEFRCSARQ